MPLIDNPLGGRSVEEWIGSSPDAKVPDRVKDRIFVRNKGRCHLSGIVIRPGDAWEVEHIKPLALGGEHRESNMAPALVDAHKAKTALEKSLIAKVDRMRRKHLGTWPKSKAKIKSRGFSTSREA